MGELDEELNGKITTFIDALQAGDNSTCQALVDEWSNLEDEETKERVKEEAMNRVAMLDASEGDDPQLQGGGDLIGMIGTVIDLAGDGLDMITNPDKYPKIFNSRVANKAWDGTVDYLDSVFC